MKRAPHFRISIRLRRTNGLCRWLRHGSSGEVMRRCAINLRCRREAGSQRPSASEEAPCRSGPGVPSPSELRPGTLENVFAQGGFNIRLSSRNPIPVSIDAYRLGGPTLDAFGSLKFALQSGILVATRVWPTQNGGESEREPLSPNEWQSNFNLLAYPPILKPQINSTAKTANAKASESTASDGDKKSKAPRPKRGNLAEADLSEMEADLPDLSLKEADLPEIKETVDLASASISQRYEKVPKQPEFEIRVKREDVKRAKREVSTTEFQRVRWNIEQSVGWVAYKDESLFCSLLEVDLLGRRYYDHGYDLKFNTTRSDNDLLQCLRSGTLNAYKGRDEIKKEELEDIVSIWEIPDIQFDRDDVVKLPDITSLNIKQAIIVTSDNHKKLGRPAKYDWATAAGHMAGYIVENDPQSARVIEELKNWFDTGGQTPDHSEIEKFVTEAMKMYKKY